MPRITGELCGVSLANTLTIAIAPGNPKITSFEDLAQPGLAVVVCAPQVPCGAATQNVEQATGVNLQLVSEESQVNDVLTKAESDQVAAGVVCVTDDRGAGDRVTQAIDAPRAGAQIRGTGHR